MQILPEEDRKKKTEMRRGRKGGQDRQAGPGAFCTIVRSWGCFCCNGKTAEFVWRGSELISFILEGSCRGRDGLQARGQLEAGSSSLGEG